MKKLLSALLVLSLLLCGCSVQITIDPGVSSQPTTPTAPAAPTPSTNPTEPASTEPTGEIMGDLQIHFIDVGQADSILVDCGGEVMLVDGGNVADGQLVVSYLEQLGIEELEYVISTHPHEDHVGGLAAVMAVFPTKHVYSPMNNYGSKAFDNFLYYVDQQGLQLHMPLADEQFTLGGAVVTVLGPVFTYPDVNDMSIVLRIDYGETSFLLTGDMERNAEEGMLNYHKGKDMKVDVLKVGHHGSSTSTGYLLLHETDPDYAVISVGTGNDYGHPHEETLSKFRDADITTFRTDKLGTVIATSDGKEITFTWGNQDADPDNLLPNEDVKVSFIGNVNSKKLHTDSCASLPKESNRVYFDSLEEALAEGYTPCDSCMK